MVGGSLATLLKEVLPLPARRLGDMACPEDVLNHLGTTRTRMSNQGRMGWYPDRGDLSSQHILELVLVGTMTVTYYTRRSRVDEGGMVSHG